MKRLRTISALVSAVLISAAVSCATASADTSAPSPSAAAGEAAVPGIYISPWGSAHVTVSDATKAWLAKEGAVVSMIAPFTKSGDGPDFDMPIGSTAGDHLDSRGRIFYPGGLSITFPKTGHTLTLEPTYIALAPTPGYAAGIQLDDQQLLDEVQLADTSAAEVLASGRPTLTGFKLDKVPFHWTQNAVNLAAYASGSQPPPAGAMFGTLTPKFDYVPPASALAPAPGV